MAVIPVVIRKYVGRWVDDRKVVDGLLHLPSTIILATQMRLMAA